MENLVLEATVRKEIGRRKVKSLRDAGLVPAVFYGRHVETPIVLTLNRKDFEKKVEKSPAGLNTIFTLKINDNGKIQEELAIAHEVQNEILMDAVSHIDFSQINAKESIHAYIPLHIIGKAPGEKMGGRLIELIDQIEVRCLPLLLPPFIEVDVTALNIGDAIVVADLKLDSQVEILTAQDQMIIHVEGAAREELETVAEAPVAESAAAPAAASEAK